VCERVIYLKCVRVCARAFVCICVCEYVRTSR